jgi:hypothetical protein
MAKRRKSIKQCENVSLAKAENIINREMSINNGGVYRSENNQQLMKASVMAMKSENGGIESAGGVAAGEMAKSVISGGEENDSRKWLRRKKAVSRKWR